MSGWLVVVQCNRSKSLVIIALLRRRLFMFRVQDVAVNRLYNCFTVTAPAMVLIYDDSASLEK